MRQTWLRLALIACAMRAMPLAAQSSMPAPPEKAEPRAQLRSNALGDPQVDIFKPSYVTVFEVVPYGGIAQLYPISVAEGMELLKDGLLTLSASRTAEARRSSAQGVRLVSSGMGTNVGQGGRTRASGMRPRSMVLIASDRPFRVGAPNVTLGQLALEMTGLRVPRVFVGEDEDIAKLVARVRPLSPEADVTVDVLALPPDESEVSSAGSSDAQDAAVAEVSATCGVANVVISAELVSKLHCDVNPPVVTQAQGLNAERTMPATQPVNPVLVDAQPGTRSVVRTSATPPVATPVPTSPQAPAAVPLVPRRDVAPVPASREKPVP
jgi:hypothetical protein